MRKFTHVQAIVIQQLQPRGAWLRIGPGRYGNQRCTLMRSATEEIELIDIRVFRALVRLGVVYKAGETHVPGHTHPRQRFILKREYRNDQDHH